MEVVNPVQDEKSDLMEDFVSINTYLTPRITGKRITKKKAEKLIADLENAPD